MGYLIGYSFFSLIIWIILLFAEWSLIRKNSQGQSDYIYIRKKWESDYCIINNSSSVVDSAHIGWVYLDLSAFGWEKVLSNIELLCEYDVWWLCGICVPGSSGWWILISSSYQANECCRAPYNIISCWFAYEERVSFLTVQLSRWICWRFWLCNTFSLMGKIFHLKVCDEQNSRLWNREECQREALLHKVSLTFTSSKFPMTCGCDLTCFNICIS